MNGTTTVTTARFHPVPQTDALRTQGRCFLFCGIILFFAGIALIIVTTVTVTFIIGPAVVVLVWGIICIFIGWRRMNLAKNLAQNPNVGNTAAFTVTASTTGAAINHPPITVFQGSTVTQGFAQMPPTQYSTVPGSNAAPMYSNDCPPYPAYGMYPTQGQTIAMAPPPPSYDDATKPQ